MKYLKELLLTFGVLQLFLEKGSPQILIICSAVYVCLSVLDLIQNRFNNRAYSLLTAAQIQLEQTQEELKKHAIKLQFDFNTMFERVGTLEKTQANLVKANEDTKKFVSQANLGLGFRAIKRDA